MLSLKRTIQQIRTDKILQAPEVSPKAVELEAKCLVLKQKYERELVKQSCAQKEIDQLRADNERLLQQIQQSAGQKTGAQQEN